MSDEAIGDRVFFTMLGVFALAMLLGWWLLAQLLT